MTYLDIGDKIPLNQGVGIEILPLTWTLSAVSHDETLFLMGRPLYFAFDKGAEKLNRGLLPGAVLNAGLNGLTFGLRKVLIDATVTIPNLIRAQNFEEADAFGFKAAIRAGANAKNLLVGVKRMNADKLNPWGELRFGNVRIQALEKIAESLREPLTMKVPVTPAGVEPNQSASVPGTPMQLLVQAQP